MTFSKSSAKNLSVSTPVEFHLVTDIPRERFQPLYTPRNEKEISDHHLDHPLDDSFGKEGQRKIEDVLVRLKRRDRLRSFPVFDPSIVMAALSKSIGVWIYPA